MDVTAIRDANDAMRAILPASQPENRVVCTRGVAAEGALFMHGTLEKVRTFSEFSEDNNPHGENDFGAFELHGKKLFWKIDNYNGHEGINLLLTVMLRDEY